MTTELTNEQIVTNLLLSNEFLKPIKSYTGIKRQSSLGEYLLREEERQKELQKRSRYSFINISSGWDSSFEQ